MLPDLPSILCVCHPVNPPHYWLLCIRHVNRINRRCFVLICRQFLPSTSFWTFAWSSRLVLPAFLQFSSNQNHILQVWMFYIWCFDRTYALLQQRQCKNDSTLTKNQLVLNLPRFCAHLYDVEKSAANSTQSNWFIVKAESFLYCLSSSSEMHFEKYFCRSVFDQFLLVMSKR